MGGVVHCNPPGNKLGNATMSWLHAYAHSLRVGAEFQCPPWIGEEVFNLPSYQRPQGDAFPVRSELDLKPDETNVCIRGYAQNQAAMIYTKKQAQEWLKPKRTAEEVFSHPWLADYVCNVEIAAHLRRGDYQGYGYPLVSEASYIKCATSIIPVAGSHNFKFVSEEKPLLNPDLPIGLSFLPDFYLLVDAPILLRANSSFSWVAGLLSRHRVFSPVVKGLEGGREHDVEFVEGNHPALSDLAEGSDMHLPV